MLSWVDDDKVGEAIFEISYIKINVSGLPPPWYPSNPVTVYKIFPFIKMSYIIVWELADTVIVEIGDGFTTNGLLISYEYIRV